MTAPGMRIAAAVRAGERAATAALVVLFAVGLAAHIVSATRPLMIELTPFVLLICGAGVMVAAVSSAGASRRRLLSWSVLVVLVTFGVEAVGVYSGVIFGRYAYGEVLGAKLLGVPPVIGFNWALVVLGGALVSERLIDALLGERRKRRWPRILASSILAGLLSALFDVVMEPSAVALGYWSWEGGTIPLRNYASWFLLAFFGALGHRLLRIRSSSSLPIVYLVVQLGFFLGLDLALARHMA